MRHKSHSAPDRLPFPAAKLFIGLVALLAVVTGLLSMHALDTTIGHSGQPTAVITELLVDGTDHSDAIGITAAVTAATMAASSDEASVVSGLIGCAAAGVLCALGVIVLLRRAMTGRHAPSAPTTKASPQLLPLRATRIIPRATPSPIALTVLRT